MVTTVAEKRPDDAAHEKKTRREVLGKLKTLFNKLHERRRNRA